MDGSRFDAWTRRRFGLAAGGLAGVLMGLTGLEATEAKQRRKHCRNVDQGCKPSGKKRRCCKNTDLQCRPGDSGRNRCCLKGGSPCTEALESQCCSGDCVGEQCMCKPNGDPCDENKKCCSGNCENFDCMPA